MSIFIKKTRQSEDIPAGVFYGLRRDVSIDAIRKFGG
jgi:hypothetical protein